MEGMAKTAVSAQPISPPTHTDTTQQGYAGYEDVPFDVFRFFNLPIGAMEPKETMKLKRIASWMLEGSETLGDGLKKLRDLEIRLGTPTSGTRYDKIFNWVRLQESINETRKKQEALRG